MMIENIDRAEPVRVLTIDEWLTWRGAGIGSASAPVIMRASPWETPLELFLRRKKLIPPQDVTYRMRRGLRLEREARAKYEARIGVAMPARCLESEVWPVARASFDGLNELARRAVEFKCPGAEDHLAALRGAVPDKYVWQCVHLLHVCGYESIDYVSYNPDFDGPELAIVTLRRERFLEERLLREEKRFWKFLVTNTPPPPGPKEIAWPWPKYALQKQ